MKEVMMTFSLLMAFVAALLIVIFGASYCEDKFRKKPDSAIGEAYSPKVIAVDGHKYITYTKRDGGCCIVHAESCWCRKGGAK